MKKVLLISSVILLFSIIFYFVIYPKIRPHVFNSDYCPKAVNCSKCENGSKECHYKIENEGGSTAVSDDTIECDC